MKRFNWLMTILAVGALAFAACEKDNTDKDADKEQPGTPSEDKELTFVVECDAVNKTSVVYSVTPSDLEADYIVVACGVCYGCCHCRYALHPD